MRREKACAGADFLSSALVHDVLELAAAVPHVEKRGNKVAATIVGCGSIRRGGLPFSRNAARAAAIPNPKRCANPNVFSASTMMGLRYAVILGCPKLACVTSPTGPQGLMISMRFAK